MYKKNIFVKISTVAIITTGLVACGGSASSSADGSGSARDVISLTCPKTHLETGVGSSVSTTCQVTYSSAQGQPHVDKLPPYLTAKYVDDVTVTSPEGRETKKLLITYKPTDVKNNDFNKSIVLSNGTGFQSMPLVAEVPELDKITVANASDLQLPIYPLQGGMPETVYSDNPENFTLLLSTPNNLKYKHNPKLHDKSLKLRLTDNQFILSKENADNCVSNIEQGNVTQCKVSFNLNPANILDSLSYYHYGLNKDKKISLSLSGLAVDPSSFVPFFTRDFFAGQDGPSDKPAGNVYYTSSAVDRGGSLGNTDNAKGSIWSMQQLQNDQTIPKITDVKNIDIAHADVGHSNNEYVMNYHGPSYFWESFTGAFNQEGSTNVELAYSSPDTSYNSVVQVYKSYLYTIDGDIIAHTATADNNDKAQYKNAFAYLSKLSDGSYKLYLYRANANRKPTQVVFSVPTSSIGNNTLVASETKILLSPDSFHVYIASMASNKKSSDAKNMAVLYGVDTSNGQFNFSSISLPKDNSIQKWLILKDYTYQSDKTTSTQDQERLTTRHLLGISTANAYMMNLDHTKNPLFETYSFWKKLENVSWINHIACTTASAGGQEPASVQLQRYCYFYGVNHNNPSQYTVQVYAGLDPQTYSDSSLDDIGGTVPRLTYLASTSPQSVVGNNDRINDMRVDADTGNVLFSTDNASGDSPIFVSPQVSGNKVLSYFSDKQKKMQLPSGVPGDINVN